MVLKAATFYTEGSSAPRGDTSGVWLKSHQDCHSDGATFARKKRMKIKIAMKIFKQPKKKKKKAKQTWPGSIKQRAEQIGAIVKGGQCCRLSRLAVFSRKDLM